MDIETQEKWRAAEAAATGGMSSTSNATSTKRRASEKTLLPNFFSYKTPGTGNTITRMLLEKCANVVALL